MEQIRRLLGEHGMTVGVAGAGLVALQRWSATCYPAATSTLADTKFVQGSPLCEAVSRLADLKCDRDHDALVRECDEFLGMLATGNKGTQFRANRKITDVLTICERMCSAAKRSRDAQRVDAAILAIDEHVPELKQQCLNAIHNTLL
jgi:hypothetical protein